MIIDIISKRTSIHIYFIKINFRLKKSYQNELNQYRLKFEKAETDLIDNLNVKQDDLRQARLQIDLLKSAKIQLEQAQDQNQRLLR